MSPERYRKSAPGEVPEEYTRRGTEEDTWKGTGRVYLERYRKSIPGEVPEEDI